MKPDHRRPKGQTPSINPGQKVLNSYSALRLSHTAGLVEASSVTATGCSITSAATVSTAGPTGNRPFRTTFFAGARLGLALAAVRFAALRALPRAIAAFLLGAFDCFLRLAMISPVLIRASPRIDAGSPSSGNLSNELSTERWAGSPAHRSDRGCANQRGNAIIALCRGAASHHLGQSKITTLASW